MTDLKKVSPLFLLAALVLIILALIAAARGGLDATTFGVSWNTWLCASILSWMTYKSLKAG